MRRTLAHKEIVRLVEKPLTEWLLFDVKDPEKSYAIYEPSSSTRRGPRYATPSWSRRWATGLERVRSPSAAKAIAGIKRRFRFHDPRHTFASTLASKGINSFTLRDLLGHTSTGTTERYARPSAEALAAVVRALV